MPGPGLAIRIPTEITKEQLEIFGFVALILARFNLVILLMTRKLLFIATLFFVQAVSVAHSIERHEHDGIDCAIYINYQQTECYIPDNTIRVEGPKYPPFTTPLNTYISSLEGFELPDIRAPPYLS